VPSDKACAFDVHGKVTGLAVAVKGRDITAHGLGEIA
jgi:hypothetical protein